MARRCADREMGVAIRVSEAAVWFRVSGLEFRVSGLGVQTERWG